MQRYQAELKTLLLAMIDHLRWQHCKPGADVVTSKRWWTAIEAYRRVLGEPEMAGPSARTVLPNLLALEHRQLTERHLEHALGRRKRRGSRKRKRKRPRHRKKRQRSRGLPTPGPLSIDDTPSQKETIMRESRSTSSSNPSPVCVPSSGPPATAWPAISPSVPPAPATAQSLITSTPS